MNPFPVLIMLGIGYAFGVYTWPLRIHFKGQLCFVFSSILIIAACLGAMHHEMGSFVAFTFSVLIVPFMWAAENRTGWVTVVNRKPRLVYVRPEDKAPRELQNRNVGRRESSHYSWAAQTAISEQADRAA